MSHVRRWRDASVLSLSGCGLVPMRHSCVCTCSQVCEMQKIKEKFGMFFVKGDDEKNYTEWKVS